MRKTTILAASAAAGVAALSVQYLFRPTPLPASGEYFLTELARAQIGPISILVALLAAFAFGYVDDHQKTDFSEFRRRNCMRLNIIIAEGEPSHAIAPLSCRIMPPAPAATREEFPCFPVQKNTF